MSVIRHWLVFPGPEISQAAEIVTDAEDADAAKGAGHRVEGPFVPADQLAGAVEALARIEGVYTRTMPGPRDALRDQVLEIIAAYRAGGQ